MEVFNLHYQNCTIISMKDNSFGKNSKKINEDPLYNILTHWMNDGMIVGLISI